MTLLIQSKEIISKKKYILANKKPSHLFDILRMDHLQIRKLTFKRLPLNERDHI